MPAEAHQFIDIGQRLSANETKTDVHEKHFDRLDASMEKLTEVSITLKEIVKHQDHALRNVKMGQQTVMESFEQRRIATDARFDQVRDNIVDLEFRIKEEIEKSSVALGVKIDEIKTAQEKASGFFDRWKWVIIGGGGVLFFLVDKLPIVETLAKLIATNASK